MNYRHYNAQMAGRDSVELFTIIFFKNKEEKATGVIMACKKNGIKVWVPKYGLEGMIFINHASQVGERGDCEGRRISSITTTMMTLILTRRRVC